MSYHTRERRESSGVTGKLFEADLLLSKDQIMRVSAQGRSFDIEDVPHKDYINSVKEIIEQNPYFSKANESYKPQSIWLKMLQVKLLKALNIRDETKLRFYPAVGTSADIWHGIDLLILCIDPETGLPAQVTIDLSKNTRKFDEQKFKTDLLVSDTRAIVNDSFISKGKDFTPGDPIVEEYDIPDEESISIEQARLNEQERNRRLADMIATIVTIKTDDTDSRYEIPQRRLKIEELFKPGATKDQAA